MLGSWGLEAARLARGEDPREVEPYREARSYSEENTFERDVGDIAELEKVIRLHAEAVARRLRRDGVRGRGVTVKLKLARGLGAGKYPLLTRSVTATRADGRWRGDRARRTQPARQGGSARACAPARRLRVAHRSGRRLAS